MRVDRSTQILAQLRTELARLRKSETPSTPKTSRSAKAETLTPSQRLPGLLKDAELSPSQQRRLLIHALLADEIAAFSNNSLQTEAVVDEIQAILEGNPAARELLDSAMAASGLDPKTKG